MEYNIENSDLFWNNVYKEMYKILVFGYIETNKQCYYS